MPIFNLKTKNYSILNFGTPSSDGAVVVNSIGGERSKTFSSGVTNCVSEAVINQMMFILSTEDCQTLLIIFNLMNINLKF